MEVMCDMEIFQTQWMFFSIKANKYFFPCITQDGTNGNLAILSGLIMQQPINVTNIKRLHQNYKHLKKKKSSPESRHLSLVNAGYQCMVFLPFFCIHIMLYSYN